MRQFAPAVMSVGDSKKMGWFVGYALPGEKIVHIYLQACIYNINFAYICLIIGQELKLPKDFEGRGGAKIMTEPSKIIGVYYFKNI